MVVVRIKLEVGKIRCYDFCNHYSSWIANRGAFLSLALFIVICNFSSGRVVQQLRAWIRTDSRVYSCNEICQLRSYVILMLPGLRRKPSSGSDDWKKDKYSLKAIDWIR